MTRLVDRLVADGLVQRTQCLTDARGAEAVLTASGLTRLRSASKTHLRGISDHFLGAVDPMDLGTVERALGAVAERAGPSAGDPELCAPDGTPGSEPSTPR